MASTGESEEAFVEFLRERTGEDDSYIGDDCAVIEVDTTTLLATVDCMVSGIHFCREATPEQLAGKLLGINRSDIAAMGGRPRWALVTSVTEARYDRQVELSQALVDRLTDSDIRLVGGDISSTTSDEFFSLTLLGVPAAGNLLRRNAARAGDLVVVSGALGEVRALLESEESFGTPEENLLYEPPNRLDLGEAAARAGVRSAIDLSDGLIKDLNRILKASNLGAELDYRDIPVADRAYELAKTKNEALGWVLDGGEDYELLFAVPQDVVDTLQADVPLSVIGRFVDGDGIRWKPDLPEALEDQPFGYDHFN